MFPVDVYRGGDKIDSPFVSFTEEYAEVATDSPVMKIP